MKTVFIVFARDSGNGSDYEAYSVGATREIAEAIIKKDVEDGQIANDAFIQQMAVNEEVSEL